MQSTKYRLIFVLSSSLYISKPYHPARPEGRPGEGGGKKDERKSKRLKYFQMNIENTQSQMRKGILEFCILSVIRRGEAYPSDIVEEMKAANLFILEGTLYPLLTRLKNASMLTYRWVESSSGPPRKYFSLTEKGEAFYQELEKTWMELSNGVNTLTKQNNQQEETH